LRLLPTFFFAGHQYDQKEGHHFEDVHEANHKFNTRCLTMVFAIHTSDSCNTLVSLDNHHNASSKQQEQSLCLSGYSCREVTVEYRKTSLLLPAQDLYYNDNRDDLDVSSRSSDYNCSVDEQSLYLPTLKSGISVDEYLQGVAVLGEACDELLSLEHHQFTLASPEKLIYVHQGEVAHALASQCDILVSDRATTCHILALRSTCASASKEAITSLTHIDSDQYETSVRAMIQEHKLHHSGSNATIEVEVSILGGYVDEEGHSRQISNWLLHLLADIAQEETCLQMRLKTCAISAMNDNGFSGPMGRGLAVHLATGQVLLAKASPCVVGPDMILRNARLWSAEDGVPASVELTVIHTTTSNELVIQPFCFAAAPGMDQLMALPDNILLEYTSTSPCAEEEDFCPTVRSTLRFLSEVPATHIFGRFCDRALRFARRHQHSNEWMLMS
jgi:Protein N-terminal asparagine amidohydrolase